MTVGETCEWLVSALQVLQLNNIEAATFSGYLKELPENGRGKWRNLYIYGESNCAKTFLLKPLTKLFLCFENQANDKYGWVGASGKEVILL